MTIFATIDIMGAADNHRTHMGKKQLMEHEFEIHFVPTHRMLAENIRKYGVGPRIPTVILCTIVYVLIIFYICQSGLWERMKDFVLILLAVEMVVFFLPHILVWLRQITVKKMNGGGYPEAVITVDDAITYQEGPWKECFDFAALTGAVRLKNSYKLRFQNRKSLLLAPDGFTKGTFEGFKQFLREKRPDLKIPE